MAQVAVVTDSTTSLPGAMYERYQITMVPYYVHMGDRVARDLVDIGPPEFNAYLLELTDRTQMPKTASPGPGDYLRAYSEAAQWAREILSIHMTSDGSGAYQAASVAKEMALETLRDVEIAVIDTRNVAMAHGWIALQCARAACEGANLAELVALAHRLVPKAHMLQTADTLQYLYLGGRIGRAAHLVGSLLRIKPIVSMDEGIISTVGVARSRETAYRRMTDLLVRDVGLGRRIRLALTHAAAAEVAQHLCELVERVVEPVETLMCELCPALTVHSGPGTVGLCYLPEDD